MASYKRKSIASDDPARQKRVKVAEAAPKISFANGSDVHRALQNQNQDELRDALVALRNKFSLKHDESIGPQDARLLLAKAWLDAQPGATDVFDVWETAIRQHTTIQPLAMGLLAALLNLLSVHFVYHAAGWNIIKALLSPTWMRRLNGGLTAAQNDHVLATLKLLNAISDFGGGRERPTLLKVFNWSQKSLPRLLSMRRKGKPEPLPLARPDIRTLYILFILSFLSPGTSSAVKTVFLEEHRDAFWALFRGLHADPYAVCRRVLEVCWEGIWLDSKVKRSLKVACFTETTLAQIVKLYDAPAESDDAPADVAHHFLLAVCTRPGTGVCFRDRGWYPREKDAEEEEDEKDKKGRHGGKIYNKLLAGVLRILKVNEDARQQELAVRILSACPELVQSYWPAASLTLEARLASKWLINMAFVASVVALPVPTSSFLLPSSTSYNPSPPPLANVLENVAPTSGLKTVLTKGLQSSSALVRHTAALTLARCLEKLSRTLQAFSSVAEALEEGVDGQWTARRADLVRAVRARVPDLQVVVAFVMPTLSSPAADADESAKARASLLSEAGLRLMWLYHLALPDVAAEARFEVGKLLTVFATDAGDNDKMLPVKRLHVLRTLPLSDQFTWSAKLGSTGKTYLHALLNVYLAGSPATQTAAGNLLSSLLGTSVLSSHDPSELALWLAALPRSQRTPGARSIEDDFDLTDEGAAVLAFLDDCVQRCMRTPYRYLDDLAGPAAGYAPAAMPSPLLATLLEQLAAPREFAPSDALAIVAFMRKLAFALVGKQPDLRCGAALAGALRKFLPKVDKVARRAVEREVELLEDALGMLANPKVKSLGAASQKVRAFLDAVDLQPDAADSSEGRKSAHELVDWYRLVDSNLNAEETERLFDAVTRFPPEVVRQLALYIPPSSGLLWQLRPRFPQMFGPGLPFEWMFAHALPVDLENDEARKQLAALVPADIDSVVRAARFVLHRLDKASERHAAVYLLLLAELSRHATKAQLGPLKQLLFMESSSIRTLAHGTGSVEEMDELVGALLNPLDDGDKAFSAEFCAHWVAQSNTSVTTVELRGASPWINFMDTEQLTMLLTACLPSGHSPLVEKLLSALHTRPLSGPSNAELNAALPALLKLANDVTSDSLTSLVLRLVARDLPAAYDGVDHSSSPTDAESAWGARRSPHKPLDTNLLLAVTLGPRTARIVAAIVYKYPQLRHDIMQRLSAESPSEDLVPVVHALLDVVASGAAGLGAADAAPLFAWAKRLTSLAFKTSVNDRTRLLAVRSLVLMAELWADKRAALASRVTEHLAKHKGLLTDATVLSLLGRLVVRWPADFASLASSVVNDALQALVRHYVEVKEDASVDAAPTVVFNTLARHADDIKVQFVDPFMTAAIQHRLAVESTMVLAQTLSERVALKPVNTNRYLQSIIQHNHIVTLAAPSDSTSPSPLRIAVIALLHTLFVKHPANACQPTHMGPLLRLYGGTTSRPDRQLLSIFKLYETHRSASAGSFLVRWTASPGGAPSAGPAHALASMDSARVFRSITALSRAKLLDFETEIDVPGHDTLYDPVFVTTLFAQALLDAGAYSALEWVELFRTNAACVAVCMLSYRDLALRQMAQGVLGSLWAAMKTASFQERDQTLHILDLLHDLLPPPPSTVSVSNAPYPPRLPLYTTLILAHALRGLFHPAAPIYPIATRFLLQRPQVDARDVPLLYGMLYSASMDDWRREQGWMLRFLAEGCAGEAEWRVLRRRHTWDLLASLFGASSDRVVRAGVLQVLANLTCIKAATTSLVFRSQLLAWLEMHMHGGLQPGEDGAFVKILENVVVVLAADAEKAERATGGQWRGAVQRCVSVLLQQAAALGVVHIASRVSLRLALLPLPAPRNGLDGVLDAAVAALKRLEPERPLSSSSSPAARLRAELRHAADLFALPEASADLYAQTVENLWRACLQGSLQQRPAALDALMPRLLLLEDSEVGEWARRMAISSLD